MKLTNIKQQLRQTDRFSIYLDGKYVFSLSLNELANTRLQVGQVISKLELTNLKQQANTSQALARCLKLLSYRSRSEWEIVSYLERKNYQPKVIDGLVKELTRLGYVNDVNFASSWVKNRTELHQSSNLQIKKELKQKHISEEIINQVLEDSKIDEVELIHQLIAKKRRQSSYKDDLKLMQYLYRRGYSYSKIKDALKSEELN